MDKYDPATSEEQKESGSGLEKTIQERGEDEQIRVYLEEGNTRRHDFTNSLR